MYWQVGVDLFRVPGFNEETVLRLLSETGAESVAEREAFRLVVERVSGDAQDWRESDFKPDAAKPESSSGSVTPSGVSAGRRRSWERTSGARKRRKDRQPQ